jgi:hypothetical protein
MHSVVQILKYFLPALIALALATPAAAQKSNRAPGFGKLAPGTKVAIMPADIELYEISGGGVLEPKADWTAAAQTHVKNAYRARQAKMGLQVVDIEDDNSEEVLELNRLHDAVGGAIVNHHFGMLELPTKEQKLNWSLGTEVEYVRAKTGADYALFTVIRDSYASADRKAAMIVGALFGVGIAPGGMQFAFTSLVDLRTGNIVWANRVIRATGDLREAAPAQETVDLMLTGMIEEVGPPPASPRPRSIRDW